MDIFAPFGAREGVGGVAGATRISRSSRPEGVFRPDHGLGVGVCLPEKVLRLGEGFAPKGWFHAKA